MTRDRIRREPRTLFIAGISTDPIYGTNIAGAAHRKEHVLMANPTIEQVLNCPSLPSLPTVALDVIALTGKRNVNLNEIARVVQNDQGLATKILRTVNSSYYGLTKPCPTITRALSYLGLSTVKSLVLGFSLVDTTREGNGFKLEEYWRRAIYGAAAARRIAMIVKSGDPEEIFIATLMQDIGMPAINAAWGAGYAALLEQTGDAHEKLASAEMAALGFNHAQAGARLGEKWRLPEEMIAAIKYHHTPDAAGPHLQFVRCVGLGVHAAAALTVSDSAAALSRLHTLAEKWFGLSDEQVNGLLEQITEDARDIARLFRVQTGQAPDINQIIAQAEEASLKHQFDVQREAETLRQTNSDLARMALTDGLTGAGNRNFFDTELHRLFAQSRATGNPMAVVMVDADKFKSLNDTYGHQVGDAVLIEIAWRMKNTAASSEGTLVCRYGGEEFVILLPCADRRSAAQLAENVRCAIAAAPVALRTTGPVSSVPVTVSVGVSMYDPNANSRMTTPELVVQAADKALYAAKSGGRNCGRIFSEKTTAAAAA